ncbi:SPW repeat domain-containing protein [Halobacterium zhouii]|uniref:SPW repeat domain-containing protein n=1 Tax=Halobacterium zhouii TaxID=2902624 RepID=UPI001E4F7B93|nr:SPW repeat protein [Halobacterium zhouii]
MTSTGRWLAGVSALIGAWIFVSAFLYELQVGHFWNNVIVGAAIVVLAAYSGYQAMEMSASRGASGLAALLGLWMIVTPFVYPGVEVTWLWGNAPTGANTAILWSDLISGALVAVFSGYNAAQAGRPERTTEAERETM